MPRGGASADPAVRSSDPEAITCPVCLEVAPAPILQCKNGHVTCIDCLSSGLKACPQCRTPLFHKLIRDLKLEQRVADMLVPCRYCETTVMHKDLQAHGRSCSRRMGRCPLAASSHCSWQGPVSEMAAHVEAAHGAIRGRSGQVKVVRHKTKKLAESRRTHALVFESGGSGFVAHLFCRRNTLYAYVQHVTGTGNWGWSLAIYGPDILEARYARRCARDPLSLRHPLKPLTTLAVSPPDDLFDLSLTSSLPLGLTGSDEALDLQRSSHSMWCIAFRVVKLNASSDATPSPSADVAPALHHADSDEHPHADDSGDEGLSRTPTPPATTASC